MQQTETYKLNKPGVDDPIAIAPLNENMDRLEAALAAETAARQSADTAETKARTDADTAETKARTDADAAETKARTAADTAETKARTDADTAETKARTAADTALDARVTALDGRVKTIELHKIAVGTYSGTGKSQTINVGFKPLFVVLSRTDAAKCGVVTRSTPCTAEGSTTAKIVDKGFTVGDGYTFVSSGITYNYMAFA